MPYKLSFALLCLIFASISIDATTFINRSDEFKIREAQLICAVKIISVRTEMPGHSVISKGVAQPIDCLKGTAAAEIQINWPGGVFNTQDKDGKPISYKTVVPSAPQLQVNDTPLLYLSRQHPEDPYGIVGWGSGIERLRYDSKSNQWMLRRPRKLSRESKTTGRSNLTTNAEPTVQSLADYKGRVQNILNQKTSPEHP